MHCDQWPITSLLAKLTGDWSQRTCRFVHAQTQGLLLSQGHVYEIFCRCQGSEERTGVGDQGAAQKPQVRMLCSKPESDAMLRWEKRSRPWERRPSLQGKLEISSQKNLVEVELDHGHK